MGWSTGTIAGTNATRQRIFEQLMANNISKSLGRGDYLFDKSRLQALEHPGRPLDSLGPVVLSIDPRPRLRDPAD